MHDDSAECRRRRQSDSVAWTLQVPCQGAGHSPAYCPQDALFPGGVLHPAMHPPELSPAPPHGGDVDEMESLRISAMLMDVMFEAF